MTLETVHTVVFSAREGGGNPCPVVLGATGLTAGEMQRMTAEFGHESAFLLASSRPDCDLRARYFVPLHEMEMCIHATIASTTVLVERGLTGRSPVVFETMLGPVHVEWERVGGRIEVAVDQFLPQSLTRNPEPEEAARALGIAREELADGPIRSVATSRHKLIVPLKRRETLDGLRPDFELLWALCDRYETTGFYPFAAGTGEDGAAVFYARQFPKRAGYNEDPATGVAASALGAYLTETAALPLREGWNSFTIFQGFAMGRPSVLLSETLLQDGKITRTRVRGSAILLNHE